METVREMLPPMLSALAEAHEQEVIHRDLKPQNIMVSRDGMPHIMDFGIARASDTSTMTTTGFDLGYAGLHVSGAGEWRVDRRAIRSLFVRRHSLRDADRCGPLRGGYCGCQGHDAAHAEAAPTS